ncbi:hypothetical protein [Roseateles amylovorans]|uniref:Tyrosine specific protein phosphatases domain-containing protein n=1 Tax=Roseateles amylovorans TaxID=2978473 RepID=A0ABY6B178_9BURK|nr:hypothetical protein [Roseateles amylovorans]UXH78790.1 hypothetical protein N4261_02290 [Roseateles amylovorans]
MDVISPDTTLALAAHSLQFQADHPGRKVLVMCRDGRGPSAQLVAAMDLYARHRDGELRPSNINAQIQEVVRSLSHSAQQQLPKTLPGMVGLCAVGTALLPLAPHDLVAGPPRPRQTSPAKPPRRLPLAPPPPTPQLRDPAVAAKLRGRARPVGTIDASPDPQAGPAAPLPVSHGMPQMPPKTRRAPEPPGTPPAPPTPARRRKAP